MMLCALLVLPLLLHGYEYASTCQSADFIVLIGWWLFEMPTDRA
jgi:hypothetical protein